MGLAAGLAAYVHTVACMCDRKEHAVIRAFSRTYYACDTPSVPCVSLVMRRSTVRFRQAARCLRRSALVYLKYAHMVLWYIVSNYSEQGEQIMRWIAHSWSKVVSRGGKVATKIVCDLDGNMDAVTVHMSLDGDEFDIDLCEEHLAGVRQMLEQGRASQDAPKPVEKSVPMPFVKPAVSMDPKAIRAWATANGHDVSPKGRIPSDVVVAYRKATAG